MRILYPVLVLHPPTDAVYFPKIREIKKNYHISSKMLLNSNINITLKICVRHNSPPPVGSRSGLIVVGAAVVGSGVVGTEIEIQLTPSLRQIR